MEEVMVVTVDKVNRTVESEVVMLSPSPTLCNKPTNNNNNFRHRINHMRKACNIAPIPCVFEDVLPLVKLASIFYAFDIKASFTFDAQTNYLDNAKYHTNLFYEIIRNHLQISLDLNVSKYGAEKGSLIPPSWVNVGRGILYQIVHSDDNHFKYSLCFDSDGINVLFNLFKSHLFESDGSE